MPRRLVLLCVLVIACAGPVLAAGPARMKIAGDKAMVTHLTGTATLERYGQARPVILKTGDILIAGDFIRTGYGSRLEITLADQSTVRFDENTKFELAALAADPQQEQNVNVRMFIGKVWGSVKKRLRGRNRFQFSSKTCIAGVRGTTYRMNVDPDETVMLKVYQGEIQVQGEKKAAVSASATPYAVGRPTPVSGPAPIPGPHPVTMEEWTYIVKSMQQIVVNPDGTVTKPFNFDPQKDLNGWVRWNKQRDAKINEHK